MPQFHRIFFALRQTWSVSGAYTRARRILFGPIISVLPSMILGTPEISAAACAAKLPSMKAANITRRNFMARFPRTHRQDAILLYPPIKSDVGNRGRTLHRAQLALTHLRATFAVMAKRNLTLKVQLL